MSALMCDITLGKDLSNAAEKYADELDGEVLSEYASKKYKE